MTPQKDRRPGYLGRAKVTALLVVSILSSIQDIIMEATDKLIVGNMIGPDAVSGTMLSSPILSFCATFEMLVSAGASVLYTRAIGDYDEKKKRQILGTAGVVAILFGILMCIFSFTCCDLIFDAVGTDGMIRQYGEEYLYFYRFTFLITPLLVFLTEIIYIDGDGIRTLFSGLALIFGNGVLSFILTPSMGMMGASLGSALGKILSLVIVLSHFMSKKYRIRPVFSVNIKDIKEILLIGGADAANSAFDFVYTFLIEIFIGRTIGDEYLVVLAVASIVYEMMGIGGGINDAMKTMLLAYRGDKNTAAMKELLLHGLRIIIFMGIGFIAVIWVAAPYLPAIYGIDPGELLHFTAWACRLTALSAIPCIFSGVFFEYYLDIGRYRLQLLGNFLDTLLVRIVFNVLFAFLFGPIGIWIGESLCTYFSVAIVLLFVYKHYGKDKFPFLLSDYGKNSINLSFCTIPEEIEKALDSLEMFLNKMRVSKRAEYLGMLFLEEMCTLIKDSNPTEKVINIDAYYLCNHDTMNVVIWSDGERVDLSDSDRVPVDLAGYLVSSMVQNFDESRYQRTSGYNRASFVIPYSLLVKEHLKDKTKLTRRIL